MPSVSVTLLTTAGATAETTTSATIDAPTERINDFVVLDIEGFPKLRGEIDLLALGTTKPKKAQSRENP